MSTDDGRPDDIICMDEATAVEALAFLGRDFGRWIGTSDDSPREESPGSLGGDFSPTRADTNFAIVPVPAAASERPSAVASVAASRGEWRDSSSADFELLPQDDFESKPAVGHDFDEFASSVRGSDSGESHGLDADSAAFSGFAEEAAFADAAFKVSADDSRLG